MSASFDPSGNIEKYILAIEKKEKRMRAIKISVSLILIFASATLAYFKGYQAHHSAHTFPRYFASELSFELVDSLLMESPNPILIQFAGSGRLDTIRGIEDYIQFELEANPEFIAVDDIQGEFIDDPQYDTAKSSYQSKNVALDIIGEKKAGNKLSFNIIPLVGNSLPLYEIDFGNGLKKKVKSTVRYTYPQEGNYFVYVRTTEQHPQVLCKLPLQIAKGSSLTINEMSMSQRPGEFPDKENLSTQFSPSSNIGIEKLEHSQSTF